MTVQPDRREWNLLVTGYGCFQFTGTRCEAEERLHLKKQWERSAGCLWATHPQTTVETLEKRVGEQFRDFGSCSLRLIERLAVARKAEQEPRL